MRFSIIKREPSYFFENIHEDLNRFLKDTFGDVDYNDKNLSQIYQSFRPAVEVKEKKDCYSVKVELPNVKKEDIDVELNENYIVINAQSKSEEEKEEQNVKISEIRYGKFTRTIPFEHQINIDQAKSEFKNGVLCIYFPKLHQDKTENVKKLKIE